jgi:hypothetical protein
MRDTCYECGYKHVAQAEVLMAEALLGYPLHALLAIGHLAEAEAELLGECPKLAQEIRIERVRYSNGLDYDADKDGVISLDATYSINSIELLSKIMAFNIENSEEKNNETESEVS